MALMPIFFFALAAPALFAICNHTDKFLINRYVSGRGKDREEVGSLILFSSLFAIIVVPLIYLIKPSVLGVESIAIYALVTNGILLTGAVVLYLYAMKRDEASLVVPFFQLIPVFGYLFALAFLGEKLAANQLISALVVIAGAMLLTVDLSQRHMSLRLGTAFLMIGSSVLYALTDVVYKKNALDVGFWEASFWEFCGMIVAGVVIFVLFAGYRKDFIHILRRSGGAVLGVNFLNETLSIVGTLILMYAALQAPLALVQVANVFQPFFVFLYGVILTLWFPRVSTERMTAPVVAQKLIAIAIMMSGAYFLYF